MLSIIIIFLAMFCELILGELLSKSFDKLETINAMVSVFVSPILLSVISATFMIGIFGGLLSEFLFGSRKGGYGLATVLGMIRFCSIVRLGPNKIGLTILLTGIFLTVIFAGLVYEIFFELKANKVRNLFEE